MNTSNEYERFILCLANNQQKYFSITLLTFVYNTRLQDYALG